MEVFFVYLWLKLDAVHSTLGGTQVVFAIIAIGCGVVAFFCKAEGDDEDWEKIGAPVRRVVIWSLAIFSLCGLTRLVLPTAQQTAVLVATHYAFKVVNTPEAEKLMTLVRAKANAMLDEEIKALTEPKGKK